MHNMINEYIFYQIIQVAGKQFGFVKEWIGYFDTVNIIAISETNKKN